MFSNLAEVRSEAAPSLDELHSRSANGDRQAESFVELLGRLPELPFYEELLAQNLQSLARDARPSREQCSAVQARFFLGPRMLDAPVRVRWGHPSEESRSRAR